MRVSDKMSFQQVNSNINKNRLEMNTLQNEASTQKKVNKPSDDPVAATRVLKQRTEIHGMDQFMKNITAAKNFVEYSEQSLADLTEVLMRAKELALSQAGDTGANEETRNVVAAEIEQLFNQSVQIGNRKLGDRFLFGGFKTTSPPFTPTGEYRGDHGEMKIPIDKEAKVAVNMPGSAAFLGYQLGRTFEDKDIAPTHLHAPLGGENTKELTVIRGPASQVSPTENEDQEKASGMSDTWKNAGINVFEVIDGLKISLKANDKAGVQDSLDSLDQALAQVVLGRSQLGSRVTTLDQTLLSLQRGEVDAKMVKSQAEDVDAFELVNEMNRAENTLKTALQTSGKLLQSSLLDFLR